MRVRSGPGLSDGLPSPAQVSPLDEVTHHPGWRRTLLAVIPFTGLAFVIGIGFELGPDGSLFDIAAYLFGVALVLWFEIALFFRLQQTGTLVSALAGGLSIFFLSKLVYLLFFAPEQTQILAELTESFFWVPVLFALVSFVPRAGWGRVSSTILAFLTPLATLVYTLYNQALTTEPRVVYALAQLSLACLVMIFLSRAFAQFYLHFLRVRNRSDALEQLAQTDPLTGLPNRLGLERTLSAALKVGQPFAILFIDLDRFKRVNDVQGHKSGDELLRAVSERLRTTVRAEDILVRLSGDEFVLLARHVEEEAQAIHIAQKLKGAFRQAFDLSTHTVHITASIGFCLYPQDGQDSDTLLRHADSAMYRVKTAGRDGLRRFIPSDSNTELLRTLEEELQGAAERGELELVYQPLYSLQTGQLVKLEALLRWRHPSRGQILPDVFIPLAEESGAIIKLGHWVLQQACRARASWRQAGYAPIPLALNVSPLQFANAEFYRDVETALRENNLAGGDIELEITEGTFIQSADSGEVIEVLQKLQSLGVRIAIDDFGTGYSSLSYLKDFPLDTIKIDRSFVTELSKPRLGPHYAMALIQAITTIAETLDLEVVAEGVETAQQAELLRKLGCHTAQGYFYARPLPWEQVLESLGHPAAARVHAPRPSLSD